MLIKDVSSKLLEGIAKNIVPLGFIFNKKRNRFRRKANGCEQIFALLFHKKQEGMYVEPVVHIKIKAIEDIYHKIALKDPRYFDGTIALGNYLLKIIDHMENGTEIERGEKKYYLIENENDIEILIKAISKYFEDYVLPYFEKYSSVEMADRLLNQNPRELSIHNPLYPMRACLGLVAAKINNNPNYEELVQIYSEEMEEAADDYKEEFSKLIRLLDDI